MNTRPIISTIHGTMTPPPKLTRNWTCLWFARKRVFTPEPQLSITRHYYRFYVPGDLGPASLDEHRKEAKENAKEAEKNKRARFKKVGTCSGGGRLNPLVRKIEHYCIEFDDPEAKTIFMKIAQDRYFDWLKKQQRGPEDRKLPARYRRRSAFHVRRSVLGFFTLWNSKKGL